DQRGVRCGPAVHAAGLRRPGVERGRGAALLGADRGVLSDTVRVSRPVEITRQIAVAGVRVPRFVYGTAWKEEATEPLPGLALDAVSRGVDAATRARHSHEAGVGAAVARALAAGHVTRDELFLQTKFTYVEGQDHRLPYDPAADHATQVRQSFERSLQHLQVDSIDSYVLHGPARRVGLASSDLEVWRAMEDLHARGRGRVLRGGNGRRE